MSGTDLHEQPDNSSLSLQREGMDLLLVHSQGQHYLYLNRCPHADASLDPMGGSVCSEDGALLTCQRHAAQFLAHTGECVAGPCLGESLTPVPFTLIDGELYLD